MVVLTIIAGQTAHPQGFSLNLNAIYNNAQNTAKNDRSYIRSSINSWNSCNNGSLTCSNGAVACYGTSGYAYTGGIPENLKTKLKEINSSYGTINDINITDGGYYIIVWDNDKWYGYLPQALVDKLRSLSSFTTFRSISFNDSGEYIIVTSDGFYTSSNTYQRFYEQKKEELGDLYSANIWQNGAVFCFEKGPTYCGTIPKNVATDMNTLSFYPKFVKFNHRGDYLMCSSSGNYKYYIRDIDKSQYATTVSYYPKSENSNTNNINSGTYYRAPIPVQKKQTCGGCYGTGKCSNCNGSGVSTFGSAHVCGACGGTGRCGVCNGTGYSGTITEYIY